MVSTGQLVPPGADPAQFRLAQSRHTVQLLRKGLEQRQVIEKSLGKAPWDEEEFQAFGALIGDRALAVLGNDHALPASVDLSLDWYQRSLDAPLTEDERANATTTLVAFQEARGQRLREILRLSVSLCRPDEGSKDRGLYYLCGGRMSWLNYEQDEEVRLAVDSAKANIDAAWQAALEAAR